MANQLLATYPISPYTKIPTSHDNSTKLILVALSLDVAIGILFTMLGALNLFGGVPSIGFLGSVAGGSFVTLTSAIGILCIALNCKSAVETEKQSGAIRNEKQEAFQEKKIDPLVVIAAEKQSGVISREEQEVFQEIKMDPYFQQATRQEIDELEKKQQVFRQQLLDRAAAIRVAQFEMPDFDDPTIRSTLDNTLDANENKIPEKSFKGANTRCIFNKDLPSILVKRQMDAGWDTPSTRKAFAENYIEIIDEGRKICTIYNFDLLYVPVCIPCPGNKEYVIQEYMNLLVDDWDDQKDLFQWAFSQDELQPYMKVLFTQLTQFICLTEFQDVKYDNIQFTKDGRLALFDLDRKSALVGLTHGNSPAQGGLLSMLPSTWLIEFVEIAQPYLSRPDVEELQTVLSEIRDKILKREQHMKNAQEFYQNHQILVPTQKLIFDAHHFEKYDQLTVQFIKNLIGLINQALVSKKKLSIQTARKIFVTKDESFYEAMDVRSWAYGDDDGLLYNQIEKQALDALLEHHIIRYKIHSSQLYIVC